MWLTCHAKWAIASYQPFIITCNLTNFVRRYKSICCRFENHTWVFMHALNVFTHIPLCFLTCISWCGTRHTRTKHSQLSMKFQIVAYYAKWKFTNNTKTHGMVKIFFVDVRETSLTTFIRLKIDWIFNQCDPVICAFTIDI